MKHRDPHLRRSGSAGFTLAEMLIAAAVFAYIMTSVSGLFVSALDIQRRGIAIQKVEENAQFVLESIARDVRVSAITSGDTDCSSGISAEAQALTIKHPDRGTISFAWRRLPGANEVGRVYRTVAGGFEAPMTADDVDIESFGFCVSYAGLNDGPARVTLPLTIRSTGGRERTRVEAQLQTTVVSRDFASDLIAP